MMALGNWSCNLIVSLNVLASERYYSWKKVYKQVWVNILDGIMSDDVEQSANQLVEPVSWTIIVNL